MNRRQRRAGGHRGPRPHPAPARRDTEALPVYPAWATWVEDNVAPRHSYALLGVGEEGEPPEAGLEFACVCSIDDLIADLQKLRASYAEVNAGCLASHGR